MGLCLSDPTKGKEGGAASKVLSFLVAGRGTKCALVVAAATPLTLPLQLMCTFRYNSDYLSFSRICTFDTSMHTI